MFKDARRELSSVSGGDRSADNFIDYSWREGRWRKEIPGDRVRARRELWMEQRQPLRRQRIGELRGCRRRHYKLQTRHFRWVITRPTLPRFTLIHPREGCNFPLIIAVIIILSSKTRCKFVNFLSRLCITESPFSPSLSKSLSKPIALPSSSRNFVRIFEQKPHPRHRGSSQKKIPTDNRREGTLELISIPSIGASAS